MFSVRFVANVPFYHPYIVRKAQLIPKWILVLLKNTYVDSSAGEGGYKRFRFKNQLLHPVYVVLLFTMLEELLRNCLREPDQVTQLQAILRLARSHAFTIML